ncbi:SPFH domain-containing protein [bacterium D16-76]|nr:SPFH domain-containing protein [bacterium D16-76]
MDNTQKTVNKYAERAAKSKSGFAMLSLILLLFLVSVLAIVFGGILLDGGATALGAVLLVSGILLVCGAVFLCCGFKVLGPNEAVVLTLFGKYYGTIKADGFYWVNPFCACINPGNSRTVTTNANGTTITSGGGGKISLKTMTLNNEKQTVNDERGNPILIDTVVIWRVVDTTKAVFNVQNYRTFLSIQCDSATRNIARRYPYDLMEDSDVPEKTLRGSSQEIADMLREDLQNRVVDAGLEIMEVRIRQLAYAPEIAAAMLQRQQAEAVVAARKKIVEGAVGMVEMALEQLKEDNVVALDEERKAQMVSNLLVVLCGSKDAQPIVNSGSLY